jgi:hypothetical protein
MCKCSTVKTLPHVKKCPLSETARCQLSSDKLSVDCQAISCPLSTVNCQLSSVSCQLSTDLLTDLLTATADWQAFSCPLSSYQLSTVRNCSNLAVRNITVHRHLAATVCCQKLPTINRQLPSGQPFNRLTVSCQLSTVDCHLPTVPLLGCGSASCPKLSTATCEL